MGRRGRLVQSSPWSRTLPDVDAPPDVRLGALRPVTPPPVGRRTDDLGRLPRVVPLLSARVSPLPPPVGLWFQDPGGVRPVDVPTVTSPRAPPHRTPSPREVRQEGRKGKQEGWEKHDVSYLRVSLLNFVSDPKHSCVLCQPTEDTCKGPHNSFPDFLASRTPYTSRTPPHNIRRPHRTLYPTVSVTDVVPTALYSIPRVLPDAG